MKHKKAIFFIASISIAIIIGIVPAFFPPSIMDYSHTPWMGADLARDITGDEEYFNQTYSEFTNSGNLSVFDLREKSYEEQIMLTTLQGLVNQENAELFLIYRDTDYLWLQQLNSSHGINYTYPFNSSVWDVVDRYNATIQGLIIYDENLLDTVNVATFLAGVYNCVVVRSNMATNFTGFGISVTVDLRSTFTSRVQLYSWAWNNYQQNATKKIACSLDPNQTFFRDYIVASKIFTFFLSGGPFGPVDEINLFKAILSQYPANIPVFGWFTDPGGALGEYESVKILSKNGKYSLCAAIPDLTIFSSIKGVSLQQKSVAFDPTTYPFQNKIYVSVIVSDGDNVNYCADRLRQNWDDPNRGTVPIGITLEPAMFKFFPTCLDYYYNSATTNEYFLAGPSGAGYCYVDLNPVFPSYLNITKHAMDRADMHQAWLLNGYEPFQLQYSDEVIRAYASENCNFTGLYLNYHDYPAELNYVVNDVPVFQSVFVERPNELVGKLQSIRLASPNTPVFVFVGYWAWDFSFTALKNAADQLGSDFVFLRPDQFAELYKMYHLPEGMQAGMEFITFIWTGLIPLFGASIGLVVFWLFRKKNDKNGTSIRDEIPSLIEKAVLFMVDFILLLLIRYCFFSTILQLLYFVYLLISITIGIILKKYMDRLLGVRENFIFSMGMVSVGGFLFLLDPKLAIITGFPIGMLLMHQIQSTLQVTSDGKRDGRDFIYCMLISIVLILLIPSEYYFAALFVGTIIAAFVNGLGIYNFYIKIKNDEPLPSMGTNIKFWYPSGVAFGFLLMFLLAPTMSPENLFFHLFWGILFFPTRLTLSFSIATLYLCAILLFEILYLRHSRLMQDWRVSLSLMAGAILTYILIPIFLDGILAFFLSNFIFIFSMLTTCNNVLRIFRQPPMDFTKDVLNPKPNSLSGFTSQFLFWSMMGLFLTFLYPSILVVDNQEILAAIGMTGTSQLVWSSVVWLIFYLPNIYLFLEVPVTIFVLTVGFISLFLNFA